jgi:hypothetical protein
VSMESRGDGDAGWGWLLTCPPELWQSYQQRHLGQVGGIDKWEFLPISMMYLKYLNGSLTCRKILQHGPSGFTSHPKEGVLQIFIALKKPSPRPGLNVRLLGPVASILTTTQLRWLTWCLLSLACVINTKYIYIYTPV